MKNVKILSVPEVVDLDAIFTGKEFPDNYTYKVGESFQISLRVGQHPVTVTIPKDFETNLDSVPRVVGVYTLFKGVAILPAVVHDYLYSTHLFDRDTCDMIFYKLMLERNVPMWRAWCIYQGVQLFGETYYKG